MKLFVGTLLFVTLNFILIPLTTIFSEGILFYLGTILTLAQIIVGFAVLYDIMVSKLVEQGDDE